jgi:hypothetical protein
VAVRRFLSTFQRFSLEFAVFQTDVDAVEFGSGEDFQARRMQRESKGLQTSGVSTTSILAL